MIRDLLWKDILKMVTSEKGEIIQKGIRFLVGKGEKVRF